MKNIFNNTKNKVFFNTLYSKINTGFIEIRGFGEGLKDKRIFIPIKDQAQQLYQNIEEISNQYNVYFGIASRKNNKSGKKENCQYLPALFADIDYGSIGHKKSTFFNSVEEILEHLQRLNLKHNVIINSGHGIHVYWILNEPLMLTPESIPLVESLLKDIQTLCGGDSIQDVSRILRVPHTYNYKEDKIEARFIYSDYNDLHSIESLKETLQLKGLQKIAKTLAGSEPLKKMVINGSHSPIDDRSRHDEKIIVELVSKDYGDEEIKFLFDTFGTTGKYLERKSKDLKGAEQYLQHSIKKARLFLSDKNLINKKEHKVEEYLTKSMNSKIPFEQIDSDFISEYTNEISGEDTGYYVKKITKNGELYWKRLTNFVMILDGQISCGIENKPVTYLKGTIKVVNEEPIEFQNTSASIFSSSTKFSEFVHELCGVKIRLSGDNKQIIEAIKSHNSSLKRTVALEFGYTEDLTQYITENLVITKDTFIERQTPILYSNEWKKNRVGFKLQSRYSDDDLKNIIIDRLFEWDEKRVTLPCFAFTLLPLIYPFIKEIAPGKPYLLLTGESGSGKSTMAKFCQSFYGDFRILHPATSTATALSIIGHSLKDALFCVDDLKLSALNSDSKRSNFVSFIQNYSDGNSRNRSNINLEIREEKDVRGMLMLNGEDILMNETSSVARGIIIYLRKKSPKLEEARYLLETSQYFNQFTVKFIQYLLMINTKSLYLDLLKKNITLLEELSRKQNLDGENLPRIINNLSLLKTSWDISKPFLFSEIEHSKTKEYDEFFDVALSELLEDNFKRVHHLKADERFEEVLWSLVSSEILSIRNVESAITNIKDNLVGWFHNNKDGIVKLGINLNVAYKKVNDHLYSEGGLGLQYESLKNRLLQNGKIMEGSTGRVQIGIKQVRGVYWLGEIPYDLLNIQPNNKTQENEIKTHENELESLIG